MLPEIPGPALIIHDKCDDISAFEDTQDAVRACSTVRLHTTTWLGHKHILTEDTVVDLALAFLEVHLDNQPFKEMTFDKTMGESISVQ